MSSVKDNLVCTSCTELPYEDSYFDLVLSTDTLHNLNLEDCKKAIKEINRVGKGNNKFIMVHSFTNEIEKNNLINWEATIRLVLSVEEWKKLFKQENYDGFYYWKLFPNL
jgi:ubiquinone/menaquinone biosynthesis C-methylase UbiE